jgi:hypothetical protein
MMPILKLHKLTSNNFGTKGSTPAAEIRRYVEYLSENVGEFICSGDRNVPLEREDIPEGWRAWKDVTHVGKGWEIFCEQYEHRTTPAESGEATVRNRCQFFVDITDEKAALMFSMKYR